MINKKYDKGYDYVTMRNFSPELKQEHFLYPLVAATGGKWGVAVTCWRVQTALQVLRGFGSEATGRFASTTRHSSCLPPPPASRSQMKFTHRFKIAAREERNKASPGLIPTGDSVHTANKEVRTTF